MLAFNLPKFIKSDALLSVERYTYKSGPLVTTKSFNLSTLASPAIGIIFAMPCASCIPSPAPTNEPVNNKLLVSFPVCEVCCPSMQQQQLEWRRAKVLELMSKGETNQSEIARILQVDRSIVCRDAAYLRQQAKENITRYVDERLPEEYEKCLVGLNSILKEAWSMSKTDDSVKSDKIKALALAKECYAMKLELLTNVTVVDDAIRFVASHAIPATIEKSSSDKPVAVDKKVRISRDTQGSEENRSHEQQQSTTTNNCIF
jgi:hypothetical protein